MRSLPACSAIVLLGTIAWTTSLVGRDPAKPVAEKPVAAKIASTKIIPTKTVTVKIDNFAFEPASLTVAKGTTVEWTNGDDIPHTVVEKKVRFKSPALDTDDRYRHTFSEPGTFSYFCSIHPHMVGEIHVTP